MQIVFHESNNNNNKIQWKFSYYLCCTSCIFEPWEPKKNLHRLEMRSSNLLLVRVAVWQQHLQPILKQQFFQHQVVLQILAFLSLSNKPHPLAKSSNDLLLSYLMRYVYKKSSWRTGLANVICIASKYLFLK